MVKVSLLKDSRCFLHKSKSADQPKVQSYNQVIIFRAVVKMVVDRKTKISTGGNIEQGFKGGKDSLQNSGQNRIQFLLLEYV